MERTRVKTDFGEFEYEKRSMNMKDIEKIIKVTIGSYFNSRFEYYEDAMKFVELAISGGADPTEIKINITFKKGEEENETES